MAGQKYYINVARMMSTFNWKRIEINARARVIGASRKIVAVKNRTNKRIDEVDRRVETTRQALDGEVERMEEDNKKRWAPQDKENTKNTRYYSANNKIWAELDKINAKQDKINASTKKELTEN